MRSIRQVEAAVRSLRECLAHLRLYKEFSGEAWLLNSAETAETEQERT